MITFDSMTASLAKMPLTIFLAASLSLTHSAIMSFAPFMASSALFTLPLTNLRAMLSTFPLPWLIIIFAKGSSPASRADSALVFVLRLNGA